MDMEIENDIINHYIAETEESPVIKNQTTPPTSRISMLVSIDSDGFEGSRLSYALIHVFAAGMFAIAVFVLLIFGFWMHHGRKSERQRQIHLRRRYQAQDAEDWDSITEVVEIND